MRWPPLITLASRRAIVAVGALAAGAIALAAAPGVGPWNGAPDLASAAQARTSSGGPACVPPTINASDVVAGTSVQVSPMPGSRDASPGTQVSFLGVLPSQLSRVNARGSRSGAHSGVLRGYSQGDGASFLPSRPFSAGESVTVSGAAAGRSFSYLFTVSVPNALPTLPPGRQPVGRPGDVQSYRSRPDLRPPTITIDTPASSTAPGLLFANPYSGPGQHGAMIFDNGGQLVWFLPQRDGTDSTALQVQQYQGRPVLTYWQGYIPPQGFGRGVDVIDDSHYHTIALVQAGNGFSADLHDFQIDDTNDTAYLTVFNTMRCNLSAVRGPTNTAVTDGVFEQIDLHTGLVRHEWHSLDHVSLSQSHATAKLANATWPFDAFHINSAVPRPGGGVLVSSRSTWSVYEVSGSTGQVLTSIGGTQSSVKMGSGTPTAWQHDAEALPDGTISIFDNGATPTVERQSRGIVERVDSGIHSVSLVRQYIHPGVALSSSSQGNFQTLPNGNAFLGWGAQPYFTEFSPSGAVVFDAHMPHGDESYRGYRFPWVGTPAHGPSLAASRAGNGLQVCASWNGATEVARWRVLGGSSSRALAAVATADRSGFETCIAAPASSRYVQVQALDDSGRVLGSSAPLPA